MNLYFTHQASSQKKKILCLHQTVMLAASCNTSELTNVIYLLLKP